MIEVAPLSYGVIFKKAFSDIEIFKAFVKAFLNIQLEIDKVEMEKAYAEPIGNIASRYDLFAEDSKNRIIVDIQHVRYTDHYHRFLHYHCAAILEQAANYNEYIPNLTVYTLVVLTSGDQHKRDISVIDFDPKDLQGQPLAEVSHKVIYICPKYLNANTPVPYREWMQAINDSLDGEIEEANYTQAEILKIFNLIQLDTVSAQERAAMIDEKREQAYGDDKYQKGVAEGEARGEAKGEVKGKIQVAKALKAEQVPINIIVKTTGLTKQEIEVL